jgi:hypothetical protein
MSGASHCLTCFLALAFLLTSLAIPFTAYGVSATSADGAIPRLVASLDPQQRRTYEGIVSLRRRLYVHGLVLGVVLAACVVAGMRAYGSCSTTLYGCTAVVVVFVTTFLYYILSPKPVYMVEVLRTTEQRRAWVDVYRAMQVTTYGSFAGALVASFVLFACWPEK